VAACEAVSEVIKRSAKATPGGASTANIIASFAADLADGVLDGAAPAGVPIPVPVATANGVNGNLIATVFDEVGAGNLVVHDVDPLTGGVKATLPSSAFANAVAAMASGISGRGVGAGSINMVSTLIATNSRTASRPVITLLGASPMVVAQGSVFTDPGSSVTDNVDTGLVATVTGAVNTATVGVYALTYSVSDAAGNAATSVTRTVNVTDQTGPVITLTGANPMTVAQGSVFTDPGSMVTDNVDTGLVARVTGVVNTGVVGSYTITYNVSDSTGNAATPVTRTVNITDQTAPVIGLKGGNLVGVAQGTTFTDPGFIASDNVDGNITAKVVTGGALNTGAAVGTIFTRTYNVSDVAGNAATPKERRVIVLPATATALPQIAAESGGSHTVALKSDGTGVAWGHSAFGITRIPQGLKSATMIAAGGKHSLALKADGTVVAWGAGTANTGYFLQYGQSIIPAGLTNITAIAAGNYHSVALKADGTVVAWGAGTTNTRQNMDYGQAMVPAGLTDVTAIAAGGFHTVALKSDGRVVAWGFNLYGQTTIPARLTGVVAIAAGTYHTLALKADGTVVAWGRNSYGESNVPAGLTGVVAIAAGGSHSLALKSDGTVVAWGAGKTNTVSSTPEFGQAIVPAGLNSVIAITAGQLFTAALKSDGTVIAWGFNNVGQTNVPTGLNLMDVTAPVITLTGGNITLALGATFTDPGYSASDDVDGNITANVVISGGPVNTGSVGTYTLNYNVSDAAGNAATPVMRTVNVTDQTAPVIILRGTNPLIVAQGSVFTDPGSKVSDNVDTLLNATVTGIVDTATVGTYTLTYNVRDNSGNNAIPVTRTVNVIDQTSPVIALIGANPLTIAQGSTFSDPGSTVTDNVDSGLTATVTGRVNAAAVGAYTLTYNVTDGAGNAATQVTRVVQVTDQTAPVITLTGANTMTVLQGSLFNDPGSSVTDNVSAGLTATVTGTVNTAAVGTYTLTYNVTDGAGNAATPVTRTVQVTADQTAPIITLTGANPLSVLQGSTFIDPGSTVTDNVDTGLTATVTGIVNTATVGTYTLTYNISDAAGNAATTVTRTVNVTATLLPTLSIAPAKVLEGSTLGTTNLVFTVTLSAASMSNVFVNYATSDGTALSTSDYTAANATLPIGAGSTTGTITMLVHADTTFEPNETLTLTLSGSVNATIATAAATGTILNDDAGGINDTGITTWGNATVSNLTVTQLLFPRQDADVGRDALATAGTLVKAGGGKAGFDFTKLDAAGVPLANQAATYAATPWSCVKDNVTGLMWEVKTTAGLQKNTNKYTWYNSTGVNDGGNAGTPAVTPACNTGGACDTEKYVAAVNAMGLCGFTDWRMPTVNELFSIIDSTQASGNATIDMAYFPNTPSISNLPLPPWSIPSFYWTATTKKQVPNAAWITQAWIVVFGEGGTTTVFGKNGSFGVRLVRGGL